MRLLGIITISIAIMLTAVGPGVPQAVSAATATLLIKGAGPAVYFVSDDDVKHVFPNYATFESWFQGAKPTITHVAESVLARYVEGDLVTVRPGSLLLRFEGSHRIYAVTARNILRYVTTPQIAARLYGLNWGKKVVTMVGAAMNDYVVGGTVVSLNDFSPNFELKTYKTLADYMNQTSVIADGSMSADQKRRAEQITSVFESGTPAFDYGVVVSLGDGRGYTAGRIGFTTGTGDAYTVVRRYTDRVPTNPLAKYLPRMQMLRENESGSVQGLEGFPAAWTLAAKDPLFRTVQDEISDEVYYNPAMAAADDLGFKYALSRGIMYDTIIQHGGSPTEPDGLFALINLTKQKMNGSPKTGVDEKQWIYKFLEVRKTDLLYPMNKETQEAWAESADRVDILKNIADSGNWDLHGPIRLGGDYEAMIL